MRTPESMSPPLKLSICISTRNRANLIGATLESFIGQATEACEIVVLDAASTDNTKEVVESYAARFARLRYIRQSVNNGIDKDFDTVVQLARGEYCWLMPDDDCLKPGGMATLLQALEGGYCLVIVNAEARDFSMKNVVLRSGLDIAASRTFAPSELDELFSACYRLVGYIGCVVIKRSVWLARARERYFGSWFIHIGVIFQAQLPGAALVLAEPLVSVRYGNQSWYSQQFEIGMIRLPTLVWSLPISVASKRKVCVAEPWHDFGRLMYSRAIGSYSFKEYRQHVKPRVRTPAQALAPLLVAALPGVLANSLLVCQCVLFNPPDRGTRLAMLQRSRFSLGRRLASADR